MWQAPFVERQCSYGVLWCNACLITWLTSCMWVLTLYRCYFSAIKTKLSLYLWSHYFATKTLQILATSYGITVTCPGEKVQPVLRSKERVQLHSVLQWQARYFGRMENFDAKVEEWSTYVERLEMFFVVNVPNEKKAASLLTIIGGKMYANYTD